MKIENIIVLAGLNDYKLSSKLTGLTSLFEKEKIYVPRRRKNKEGLEQKIRLVSSPFGSVLFFRVWRFFWSLTWLRRNRQSAIVGVQFFFHGFEAFLLGKLSGRPVIQLLIGSDLYPENMQHWQNFLLETALPRAASIGVLGPVGAKLTISKGASAHQLTLMQNFHNPDRFPLGQNTLKTSDIVFIGNLLDVKRVDWIIRLLPQSPKLQLKIVGDGPLRQTLEELAISLGVGNRTTFTGFKTDITCFLLEARVLVLASRSEGVPAVAIEAMLTGLPVVLPRVGDIPTYFTHNLDSILFDPKSYSDFEMKTLSVLNSPKLIQQLQVGACQTREKYLADWSADRQAAIWTDLVKTL